MDAVRVMLVDRDPVSLAASAAALHDAGIDVVAQAASGEEAVRLVLGAQPTVAVIDLDIGGMGPATASRRIRSSLDHRVDVVAQASLEQMSDIGDMVATGTAAYIVKGKLDDLVAAVQAVAAGSGLLSAEASRPLLEELHRRYEAERLRGQELEQSVALLKAASVTDWLTGLKNHGYFWQRLGEELERARRYSRPVAVIMADLDDFKAVNDEFGHAAGDKVLRSAGAAITASTRDSDIACRVGGEEFAIIVPETSAVGALQLAERIREAVALANIDPVGSVTVSLGVAVYPFHATEGRELVEAADRALYDAKHAGKNCSRLAGGPSPRSANPTEPPASAVAALIGALALRDPRMVRHSERVADLALAIGEAMDLQAGELDRLRVAAMLHDVGMIGMPMTILEKSEPLSETERATLSSVPELGAGLVARVDHQEVAATIYAMRERQDGSGYPNGLSGADVPVAAKILAVADAYDSLLTKKPWRPRRGHTEAMAELRRSAGTRFDPAAVAALERVLADDGSAQVIDFPA